MSLNDEPKKIPTWFWWVAILIVFAKALEVMFREEPVVGAPQGVLALLLNGAPPPPPNAPPVVNATANN